MNDIRVELGVPSQSPFGLNEARNGTYVALNSYSPTSPPSTGQVSLSDWYGYCQNCFSHSFSYNSLLANKCVNNDPITIISNTNPIVVGSLLYLSDYSQAFYPYYYTDGSNWYYANANLSEQTEVISKGTCAPIYSATVYMNSFVDYPYGYVDAATACSLGGFTGVAETVYYQGTLGNGTVLYFGSNLTNQFSADGSYGYYWISGYSFTYSGSIGSYTACSVPTLFYIQNSSLDITITDVKVNGVSLTGVTGSGFPVSTGDSVNGYSNQLGTQNVDIYYSLGTYGQHIEGYDSNLTYYCNDTVGVGSGKITQFGGAYVGSGTFQIYAYDGSC